MTRSPVYVTDGVGEGSAATDAEGEGAAADAEGDGAAAEAEGATDAEGDGEVAAVFLLHAKRDNARMNTKTIADTLFIVYPPLDKISTLVFLESGRPTSLMNVTKNPTIFGSVISITALKSLPKLKLS